jgi:hypothetical protein
MHYSTDEYRVGENPWRRSKMGREDEIRMIAHDIWEQEGCLDGHDREHWLKAEAIWEENQKKVGYIGIKPKFKRSGRQNPKDKEGRLIDDAYYSTFTR